MARATKQKKTVLTSTIITPQSDITKARHDIEAELKLLYAMLPQLDEEGQKKLDQISGSIDDCLDIICVAEGDLEVEKKDLQKELETANDRIRELEQEAAEPIDPEELDDAVLLQVFGNNPIVVFTKNLMDEQFVEVLSKLTGKGRPHELLRSFQLLENPRVARQVEEMHELDEMLY